MAHESHVLCVRLVVVVPDPRMGTRPAVEATAVTFGLIGRCDAGGLASLTQEIHRHLGPARTLVLDLDNDGRGSCDPDAFTGNTFRTTYPGGAIPELALEWLTAEGIDLLVSAETFYDDHVLRRAHQAGIRTALYAMPELAAWAKDPGLQPAPRTFYAPTGWRLDTLPLNTLALPTPVARDRLPFVRRDGCTTLYHTTGAAFHDRHGTRIVLDALQFVTSPVRLRIRISEKWQREEAVRLGDITSPNVHIEWLTDFDATAHYWETIPADTDLLVLPRRYGGLSLVVQEAASLGIPSLMLATDPYASESFIHTVPATRARPQRMKGGDIPVHAADPRALAAAIDFLADHPTYQTRASNAADLWAAAHAWDSPLGQRWCALLTGDCAERAA